MKKYMVGITTTFDGSIEIDAETVEEAIKIARELVSKGEINTLEFEFETDVHYAEEVGDE